MTQKRWPDIGSLAVDKGDDRCRSPFIYRKNWPVPHGQDNLTACGAVMIKPRIINRNSGNEIS